MPDRPPIRADVEKVAQRVRGPKATEDDVLVLVRQAAALGGWLCYHTHDSRRSPEGFPDIVAVHPGLRRLVFAELKSAKGKLTPGQPEWLGALTTFSTAAAWCPEAQNHLHRPRPEVYLWRPADVDQIIDVFLGHRLSAIQGDRDSSLARDTTTPGGPD